LSRLKTDERKSLLIVSCAEHVDDLIFTGNNKRHVQKVKKKKLQRDFDMMDLGRISYYQGVEII